MKLYISTIVMGAVLIVAQQAYAEPCEASVWFVDAGQDAACVNQDGECPR